MHYTYLVFHNRAPLHRGTYALNKHFILKPPSLHALAPSPSLLLNNKLFISKFAFCCYKALLVEPRVVRYHLPKEGDLDPNHFCCFWVPQGCVSQLCDQEHLAQYLHACSQLFEGQPGKEGVTHKPLH